MYLHPIINLQAIAVAEYYGREIIMDTLKISPDELFGTSDDVKFSINGIPTKVISSSDEHGNYFAILATDPSLSDICGELILGKLIREVDYLKYQGHVAVIKAYY